MKKHLRSNFGTGFLKVSALAGMFLGLSFSALQASPVGYNYRTFQSGDWYAPATWERSLIGAANPVWQPVTNADIPDATAGEITILPSHEVTLTNPVIADEILISIGATLDLKNSLTIPAGSPSAMVVTGALEISTGSLFMNDNVISGGGEFFLYAAGILGIGSPLGINNNSTGNVQITGTKILNPEATYIYNGTSAQITGNALPNTKIKLAINNPAGVTLSAPTSVSALFLDNGKLVTSAAQTLTVEASGTVYTSIPGSFVEGPVSYVVNSAPATLKFPIGSGSVSRPVELKILSQSATETYTAQLFDSPYNAASANLPVDVTHVSRVRYFTLSKSGTATVNANVKLTYSSDDGVTDPAKLTIVKYNGTSVENLFATASGDLNSGTITSGNFTTFSDFMLANTNGGTNPLPVELMSFSGKLTGKSVLLNWVTASEQDNDRFEVQRSANGSDFIKIGTIKGAGTTSSQNVYQLKDQNPVNGLNYYRLKQIDRNGETEYSKIISVNLALMIQPIEFYPNPTSGNIKLKAGKGPVEVQVLNVVGQEIFWKNLIDGNAVDLNLENLPAGTYQLLILRGQDKTCHKLIKTN